MRTPWDALSPSCWASWRRCSSRVSCESGVTSLRHSQHCTIENTSGASDQGLQHMLAVLERAHVDVGRVLETTAFRVDRQGSTEDALTWQISLEAGSIARWLVVSQG